MKRKLITIISLTGVFAMWYINSRYCLFANSRIPETISDVYDFSVMTFNVASTSTDNFSDDKQNQLLELLEQERPDIVCFQELSYDNLKTIRPRLDSIYGFCDVLKGSSLLYRMRFYSHFPLRNFCKYKGEGEIDTTGMNVIEKQRIEQDRLQMVVMSAEFEVKSDRWIKVFSGQLRSSAYSTARRSLPEDACWVDGLSLYWYNYKMGKRIRNFEARNVSHFVDVARQKGLPVLVAGDLNDWCGSDCLNILMESDLKDAWWEGGNGFGWTYFGWHLRLRLDHILYGEGFELVDVKVIDTNISDHKPLVARFRLP